MHAGCDPWETHRPSSFDHPLLFQPSPAFVSLGFCMEPHGHFLGYHLPHNAADIPHSEFGCAGNKTNYCQDGRPSSCRSSAQISRPLCFQSKSIHFHSTAFNNPTYLQIMHHRPHNRSTFPAITNLTLTRSVNIVSKSFVFLFLILWADMTSAQCSLPRSSGSCTLVQHASETHCKISAYRLPFCHWHCISAFAIHIVHSTCIHLFLTSSLLDHFLSVHFS